MGSMQDLTLPSTSTLQAPLSDSAADLTSCEQESVPQNGGKLFVAIAYESALYTVDVEHSFDRHLLVSS